MCSKPISARGTASGAESAIDLICAVLAQRLGDLLQQRWLGSQHPGEDLSSLVDQAGAAAVIADPSVDLVDICLPTRLHAEVAVRTMWAGRDVLIELPLACPH